MIAICLATYNGEKYLSEQIESLLSQTYKSFDIFIRDDHSSDNTLEIIKYYSKKDNRIRLVIDEKKSDSAKENFSIIVDYVLSLQKYDYFMFCDQDDVWLENKIEKSMQKMQELELNYLNIPLLVHTDLEVVDSDLNTIDKSFWKYEKINPYLNSLNRLILQNTITGSTMLMNKCLVEHAMPIPKEAIMHDWWIGLVVSTFGEIGIVDELTIKYRQHTSNSIGAKEFDIHYMLQQALSFDYINSYIRQAECFFKRYKNNIDNKTIAIVNSFVDISNKSYLKRVYILRKYKLLKQGLIRNIGLFMSV